MVIILFTVYFHSHIGIDWLEDIWHGDMNKSTKYFIGNKVFLFNIETYLGHVISIPALFAYQYLFF